MQINSEQEMKDFAQSFMNELIPNKNNATVIALQGDLGAGKTTFTRACLRELGVVEKITSPTFVIQKEYVLNEQKWTKAIHLDVYRMETKEELSPLNWKESIKYSKNIIFVEWPENVIGAMPEDVITIQFNYIDENTREVTVEK